MELETLFSHYFNSLTEICINFQNYSTLCSVLISGLLTFYFPPRKAAWPLALPPDHHCWICLASDCDYLQLGSICNTIFISCTRLEQTNFFDYSILQLILKEINPEYSLEGLMLKLQYFDQLIQIDDLLEKMLGKTEGWGREQQRM